MKADMKVGEIGFFMHTRIKCDVNEDLLGRRRCTQCAFEELPEMCYFLHCWPTKKTRKYYRICEKRRRNINTNTHKTHTMKKQHKQTKKDPSKMTIARAKKILIEALKKDDGITDFIFLTAHGFSIAPEGYPWLTATQCYDDLVARLAMSISVNVEVRTLIEDAMDAFKEFKCEADDVEKACYRAGRLDVWEAYCKASWEKRDYDWKAALGMKGGAE